MDCYVTAQVYQHLQNSTQNLASMCLLEQQRETIIEYTNSHSLNSKKKMTT